MKGTQKQVIESYQRVQVFLTGNSLPPPASYGTAKEQLDEVVARLTTHSGDPATTTRLGMAETQRLLAPLAAVRSPLGDLMARPSCHTGCRRPSPEAYTRNSRMNAELA